MTELSASFIMRPGIVQADSVISSLSAVGHTRKRRRYRLTLGSPLVRQVSAVLETLSKILSLHPRPPCSTKLSLPGLGAPPSACLANGCSARWAIDLPDGEVPCYRSAPFEKEACSQARPQLMLLSGLFLIASSRLHDAFLTRAGEMAAPCLVAGMELPTSSSEASTSAIRPYGLR